MNPLVKLVKWYFSRRALPYWSIVIIDSFLLFCSGLTAYWFFLRGAQLQQHFYLICNSLFIYVALSWIGMRLFSTYTGIVRFSSFVDLRRVIYSNLLSMLIALIINSLIEDYIQIPYLENLSYKVILMMYVIATLLMFCVRIAVKTLYDIAQVSNQALRVLIYGTMTGGVAVAKTIRAQIPARFVLKGFITHESHSSHYQLMGAKVYGVEDDLTDIIERDHIDAVLVSPLRNDDFRRDEALQDRIINAGLKIFMMKGAEEWNGEDEELNLQEVSVEDLLPRDEIVVDMKVVGKELTGKSILITGSAGSIGSEMVRQVAIYKPSNMVLIDQAETPQHDIRLMMAREYPDIHAETIVTSICKKERMEELFAQYKPEYVFHAAAYKHVPMMEDNPKEAIQNNVYGTRVIADLAVKYGTRKFVMISTDKAVNPTNVMGCSKRICEIYCQALNAHQKTTQFVTTRFGNVLGSNGSVIPLFQEQIKNGGPVTVTHKDIIRYFMLIPEACKLVLEAGTMGKGGEIFVFDMGKPVRIMDLARRMIKLSGAKNIEIKVTGLRDGEKLYEEVLSDKEKTVPTVHPKIMVAKVREYAYEEILKDEHELYDLSFSSDDMTIVKKMKEIVPEFKSQQSKYEILDKPKATD